MIRRVRAADPAKLFRGGGRTLGDLARNKPVPPWVPYGDLSREYQLTSLLEDEHAAAANARKAMWSDHLARLENESQRA